MQPRFHANISYIDLASALVDLLHAQYNDIEKAQETLDELDSLVHAKWAEFAERGIGTYNWTFAELGWIGTQKLRNIIRKQQDRAANAFLGTELLCVIVDKQIGEYTQWEVEQAIYRLADAWLDVHICPSLVDYVCALETSVARFTLESKPRIKAIQTFCNIFHDIRVNLLPLCLQTTYSTDMQYSKQFFETTVFPYIKTAGARLFLKVMIQKYFHRPGDNALFGQEMGEPIHAVDMERANKQLYGQLFNVLMPLIKSSTDFSVVMELLPVRIKNIVMAVAFDSYMYATYAIPNFFQTTIVPQPLPCQLYARLPFLTFIGGDVGVGTGVVLKFLKS